MSVAQLLLNRGANVNFTPKVSLSELPAQKYRPKNNECASDVLCEKNKNMKNNRSFSLKLYFHYTFKHNLKLFCTTNGDE